MAYLPPVNLPNLQDRNYSRELYGMISDVGNSYYGARRDSIEDDQWAQEQARIQSDSDRDYALRLRELEHQLADTADDAESFYGSPQWYERGDGSMGFGVLGNRGTFKDMPAPDGASWAPPVTYQDLGNARVPVYSRGGSVAGPGLPVQGGVPTGYGQTGGVGPDGLPAIAPYGGSQQSLEANQKRSGAQQALMTGQQQAETVFTTIDAIGGALDSGWATGIGGRIGTGINQMTGTPTEASRMNAAIDTIRALTSRDALMSMRMESPTGAAVGNVSDFENRLMAATAGVLDPDRDPEGTKRTLADIRDKWEDFTAAREIAYLANFEGLPADIARDALDSIRNGADAAEILAEAKRMMGGR